MRMDFRMQSDAPMYSRKRHRQVFLTMAAAELTLLCVLIISFIRYRLQFDLIELAAGLMVVLALGSWLVRHSVVLAQVILFLSLISLELFLLADPPFQSFRLAGIIKITSDLLPALYLAVDVAVLWYFLLREAGLEDEEEESKPDEPENPA
ncbi:MAG: hypothetical protein KGH63_04780 [Candidatus Micrarchaeota archaeon]|nr:hypothetical protein [Candidatus Micrarchaeota archaeon]